jgi:hypothetical protein
MTPKKSIARRPVYTLDDGSPIPRMGKEFNKKENAFIYWYTNPGTEAFMNAGRAAVRAGYKPENAVIYGYQLKRKPEIAHRIDDILGRTKEGMRDLLYRIAFLCRDRMFFNIADFYRKCKRTVKIRGREVEVDSFEIIPLGEISEQNRMCIDGITYKGPHSLPFYILPNRDKAFKLFMKCYKILMPAEDNGETDWKATAEIIRGDIRPPVIAPGHGKAPENVIDAL